MRGVGFFTLYHKEEYFACWDEFWWYILLCVAAHYTSFQWIIIYRSARCECERMWQSSHSLIHLSLKIIIIMGNGSYVWFWILIVSMVSEVLPCPPDLWVLWCADFLTFYQQMFFRKFTGFRKLSPVYRGCLHSLGIARSSFLDALARGLYYFQKLSFL